MSVVCCVIASIASVFIAGPILAFIGVHQIPQGFVGVYYRFGVLQPKVTKSGINFLNPLTTSYEAVQITMQIDEVRNIPCGTSGGVVINFEKIEVVNRLRESSVLETVRNYTADYDKIWIYDKIHHEINQYCSRHTLTEVFIEKFDEIDEELIEALKVDISKWAPGIEIISVRVTKPVIPSEIKSSFELIESKKAQIATVLEKGKLQIQVAQNKVQKLLKDEQQKINLQKITLEQALKEKENEFEMSQVENDIWYEKKLAQVKKGFIEKEVELESVINSITSGMLETKKIESMLKNSKIYIGSSIPKGFGRIGQNFDESGVGKN